HDGEGCRGTGHRGTHREGRPLRDGPRLAGSGFPLRASGGELAPFLAHAGSDRPLFEFLAYTGLRIGEALGLTWADVNHEAGVVRPPPTHAEAHTRPTQDRGRQARSHPGAHDRHASASALAGLAVQSTTSHGL